MTDLVNAANGEAGKTLDSASPIPVIEVQDAGAVRSQLFDVLADVEARADRRYDSLARRLSKLEKRSGIFSDMPEEVKTFLLLMGLYVGVNLLLPEILRMVSEWRRSSQ